MDDRKVFGSTLRGDSQQTEAYERIHTGLGDGIMLRPAIIGNMKRYPERRHVLHIYKGVACIFEDIKGLEVVPIIHPEYIDDVEIASRHRYDISATLLSNYNLSGLYRLSTPCADYEILNSPYNSILVHRKRIVCKRKKIYTPKIKKTIFPRISFTREASNYAIATGAKITESRQQIFCDTVGVPFSLDNYNIKFSDEELQIADNVIGHNDVVGVHMRTSTHQRDYKYMIDLVDHIASKVSAVITLDKDWVYRGRRSNVISSLHGIREKLAIISKLKMLIGPDSFAVHAAGALGIPAYGIFGPTDPVCRLTYYKNTAWSDKWRLPVLRRGFKPGCGRQYCWYKTCKSRGCLNARLPRFYWNDAIEKLQPGV